MFWRSRAARWKLQMFVKELVEESGRPESEAGTPRLFVINCSKSIACHD